MSTDDWANYEALPLRRDELFERTMAVFVRQRIRFLEMARGAVWDPLGFRYAFDQDLENLDSPREALLAGQQWQRLIMDFALPPPAVDLELHLFHGQPRFATMEGLSIRYNETESRLARNDRGRADAFLALFQDLGVALDQAAMVCGSDLDSRAYSAAELEKAFASRVAAPIDRAHNFMHTALFQDDVFQRLKDAPGLAAYARRRVAPGYQLATLLIPS
ncbi:MAG TPA: hypothetical protein VGH56_09180 [Solirubrobacteraceae bacterium]